jgi:CBS domain-containing protein
VVEVDESVDGAVNVMLQRRYASLPVVNRDGELVGVVHLLDVLGKRGAVSLYVKVMGSYVRPDSALYDAWEAMSREGTTWMPGEGRGTHRDIDGGIHEEDIRFMDSLD